MMYPFQVGASNFAEEKDELPRLGNVRPLAANGEQQLDPIHHRHVHVDNGKVHAFAGEHVEGFGTARSAPNLP
jgi:hypothetical protein